MNKTNSFESLGLIEPILKALASEGYERPMPIQEQAIPSVLEGKDLLGCARTGTGKTAAFAIPAIQMITLNKKPRLPGRPRVLVLTPTRELAAQVEESFRVYGAGSGVQCALAFGGVGKGPQIKALAKGVDVLVATPGRLLDLASDGSVKLDYVELFVLDEADRMLDMGFIHDMKRVFKLLPAKRQTLLFSATMPKAIEEIAAGILHSPVKVAVDPVSSPAENITQRIIFSPRARKRRLLEYVLENDSIERALVFTRTKHLANRVAQQLTASGIPSAAIHANKSQNQRTKALSDFKEGKLRTLIATDIAARGIDIDDLTHVINFEIPNEAETYVHRIGRTARAGATGVAISFCDETETTYIKAIERLIGKKLDVLATPELPDDGIPLEAPRPARNGNSSRGRQGSSPRRDEPSRNTRPSRDAKTSRREPSQARPIRTSPARGLSAPQSTRPPREEGPSRSYSGIAQHSIRNEVTRVALGLSEPVDESQEDAIARQKAMARLEAEARARDAGIVLGPDGKPMSEGRGGSSQKRGPGGMSRGYNGQRPHQPPRQGNR